MTSHLTDFNIRSYSRNRDDGHRPNQTLNSLLIVSQNRDNNWDEKYHVQLEISLLAFEFAYHIGSFVDCRDSSENKGQFICGSQNPYLPSGIDEFIIAIDLGCENKPIVFRCAQTFRCVHVSWLAIMFHWCIGRTTNHQLGWLATCWSLSINLLIDSQRCSLYWGVKYLREPLMRLSIKCETITRCVLEFSRLLAQRFTIELSVCSQFPFDCWRPGLVQRLHSETHSFSHWAIMTEYRD